MYEHFNSILISFLDSIKQFLLAIKQPTHDASNIISITKKSKRFDKITFDVHKFIVLIEEITSKLKVIILSMNTFFIVKDIDSLESMLANLRNFLIYITSNDIFMKLDILRTTFINHHTKLEHNIDLLNNIFKVKTVITSLFMISIEITAIFIPSLFPLYYATKQISKQIDKYLNKDLEHMMNTAHLLEEFAKMIEKCEQELLNLELKTELISSLDMETILSHIETLDINYIITELILLETEYNDLVLICLRVRHVIQDYEKQPAGFFYKLVKKLRRSPSISKK
jgi:hypothetical protein